MDIRHIAEIAPIARAADHIDVKHADSRATLREFIAGMLAFEPAWMRVLYGVRGVFVRFLGMKQERQPVSARFAPADVPMTRGDKAVFFTVRDAIEDRLWVAEIRDQHLDAWLAVIAEPLDDQITRYHVATLVKYNKWTGPVYFNVIRPFHHVVVGSMVRAGAA